MQVSSFIEKFKFRAAQNANLYHYIFHVSVMMLIIILTESEFQFLKNKLLL